MLSDDANDITIYLMYFCGGWIIFWCILTILVNICHGNKGQHRFIHFYEELAIILVAVCTCILNFAFARKTKPCKIIAILIQFFMTLACAIFFMESIFASSMVHGKSDKNGSLHWIFNLVIPIILAVIPTLATFFADDTYYGNSGIHCFVVSTVDTVWGYIIPLWVILAFCALKAQLACIACDKQQDSQDEKQCYWGRRSVKSLVLISYFLFSIWLMILYSAEHQRMFLFVITTVLVLIFGPTLFIIHTYCHMNTCQKWSGSGCFSSLYAMCPPRKIPEPQKEPNESLHNSFENEDPPKSDELEDVEPENDQPKEKLASPKIPKQNYAAESSENIIPVRTSF
ncbi:unnamed protein product [Caenorhabditis bovis]|uniref:G-protein coupled receptors family 2 profile 2 domain-containing protein n=1 Tax=Caenorhabditis bovis TaxID=2654633 RepID=A0A8S1EKK9_9PELO|nr:unnamed protein product [Caenorhabditis bovis]